MIFGRVCLRFIRETMKSAAHLYTLVRCTPIGLATLLALLLVCNPNSLHSQQAVVCSTGSASSSREKGNLSGITLDLIAVNGSWKHLSKYCPCKPDPPVARWVTEREKRQAEGVANRVLLLSVGDSLASDEEIARWVTAGQNIVPATRVTFDGWAFSQNDAVVAENYGVFAALSSSQLPFLSANLVWTDGVRPFDAYQLLESDGHCIALIGLAPAFSSTQLRSKEPVAGCGRSNERSRQCG